MEEKELNALIALLDDPDREVYQTISEKIITSGISVIPFLEKNWEYSANLLVQNRIENLIHTIQLNYTLKNLSTWYNNGVQNLLEGAYYIALYQFPEIKFKEIEKSIEKIKKDVWLELNKNLTALEKVKILNHVIYDVHGINANTTNFFSPQNHYINQVLETKKGGPVALAIIYSVIAQKLGLPIYTVNLPKNFILAYKDRFKSAESADFKDNILFYINPFNRGSVLGHKEIEQFLKQQQIEIKDEYFLPCSNATTISQLVFSLIFSYEKSGNHEKVSDLKQIINLLQKPLE
jgi:regulator of sirC expression with transglutaminase-like and TPR domain